MLPTDHDSALAFLRSYRGETTSLGDAAEQVLCVFSFLHNPISFTITAPELAGAQLTDLFGGSRFPAFDDEGRVTLTLGTQSFFWLKVTPRTAEPTTATTAITVIPAGPEYRV